MSYQFSIKKLQSIRNTSENYIQEMTNSFPTTSKTFVKTETLEMVAVHLECLTGNGTIERAIQTTKNLKTANSEDGKGIMERRNRALKLGLKKTQLKLRHSRK